ncbi:TetR/AcrR family transcriptional regulator [Corynebacterium sp.]|uniref:TetR/AcrR family transcriptional regulator n=1 Tax=Corynebacterium sp. TaxID=1720 RepID=UPI0019BB496B|nr:TetR/AcrR family transcriptional regulator [Corynebacterium sp.]HHU66968.1 TetR/AcrR family transcriptional regulator [Corynebacterium sp.]
MANQSRRDQIAAAATELFAQRGYFGTGMEDIATAVGMGTSSLYNHFRSKQEVLSVVLLRTMEDQLRTHARALAGAVDPVDKLHRSMIAHVQFHTENVVATRVINTQVTALAEPHRSMVHQLRRDYVSRWQAIIDEGVGSGQFTVADRRITCFALLDMGIGIPLWYDRDGRLSQQELIDCYADMALRLVGVDPAVVRDSAAD